MSETQLPTSAFADTKPHYHILDGLRGVAAVTVLIFHIFEAFATSHLDQIVNHGYLAVDFFFILSGFVVGYAYDNRWGKMTLRNFFKRRVVRLHPMVVAGSVIGGAMFYLQVSDVWDVSAVGVGALVVATLLGALLIPVPPGAEIRGLGEMFPLNGPSWSLFFEYIGNILYALFLRRFSIGWLTVTVVATGIGLASFAIFGPTGDLCVGYSLTGTEFTGGSLRLLFAFSAGLLISRIFRPMKMVRGTFWVCSLAIVALAAVPRIGGAENLWMNGIYDTVCCVALFPLLVWMGASGKITGRATMRLCKFLGDISYPLYLVHYPFIYLYYAWVKNNSLTFVESLPGASAVVVVSIALAYGCMRFYDIPLRRRLTARFLAPKS